MEKKYKAKLHIPTRKYEFVEVELEATPEKIVEVNRHFNNLLKQNGAGIPRKEFNLALDTYLTKNTGDTETYLQMSDSQKMVFQEIKKSLKRQGYEKMEKVPIKENL